MRILFINTLYPPDIGGGAEIILKAQVEAFRVRGHKVSVITLGKTSEEDEVDGIKIHRVKINNIYFHYPRRAIALPKKFVWHIIDSFFGKYNEVKGIIDDFEPDIVSCHNLVGFGVGILDELARSRTKTVLTLHDQYLLCARSNMFREGCVCERQCADCKILRVSYRRKVAQLDGVVGVSNFILDKLSKLGYFREVPRKTVIHNPPYAKLLDAITKVSPSKIVKFGYLGTIAASKGIELLLEEISKLECDFTLIVAGSGEGDYVERLKSKYANDRIKFIGYVSAADFYQCVECVIVPSIWEDTFPGVAQEAIAGGRAVIGSRRGGIPEIVIDKVNGILFDPNVAGSLQEAMHSYIANRSFWLSKLLPLSKSEVDRMGDHWVKELEDFYQEVIKE